MSFYTSIIPAGGKITDIEAFYKEYGNGGVSPDPKDIIFTGYNDKDLVGVTRLASENGEYVLRGFLVRPDSRQLGVGGHLLQACHSYVQAHSIQRVYCISYATDVEFYGSIGFKEIPDSELPSFLQERIQGYRARNPQASFIALRRDKPAGMAPGSAPTS